MKRGLSTPTDHRRSRLREMLAMIERARLARYRRTCIICSDSYQIADTQRFDPRCPRCAAQLASGGGNGTTELGVGD